MVMKGYDPHTNGGQYLEDISTAYWVSDALFTALEMNIFEIINDFGIQGATPAELAQKLGANLNALTRYLDLLVSLGLIGNYKTIYYNQLITKDYLLKESPLYQGDSILWRKNLAADWSTLKSALKNGGRVNFLPDEISEEELNHRRSQYIKAMDNVAKLKANDCTRFFNDLNGDILDIGTGSGAMSLAFLARFPDTKATLLDIEQILPYTKKHIDATEFSSRVDYHPGNILEPEWGLNQKYQLIILSNIVHAYAETENELVLKTAAKYLADDGIILIHDFFNEHDPIKAHLSDVNMLLNTYNGKVFSGRWVIDTLLHNQLSVSPLIPLETDTALIFAAKSPSLLKRCAITAIEQLIYPIKALGFQEVYEISPLSVVISNFVQHKCRYGCDFFDKKNCDANTMSMADTKDLLAQYTTALLLKGEPPTHDFQLKILAAEKLAFNVGYHKTFALWAGPCALCPNCDPQKPCNNTNNRRPSMEGSGIDVFETVRANGEHLKTLSSEHDMIKYYGLLLLE